MNRVYLALVLIVLLVPALFATWVYPATLIVLCTVYCLYEYVERVLTVQERTELEKTWHDRFTDLENEVNKIKMAAGFKQRQQ